MPASLVLINRTPDVLRVPVGDKQVLINGYDEATVAYYLADLSDAAWALCRAGSLGIVDGPFSYERQGRPDPVGRLTPGKDTDAAGIYPKGSPIFDPVIDLPREVVVVPGLAFSVPTRYQRAGIVAYAVAWEVRRGLAVIEGTLGAKQGWEGGRLECGPLLVPAGTYTIRFSYSDGDRVTLREIPLVVQAEVVVPCQPVTLTVVLQASSLTDFDVNWHPGSCPNAGAPGTAYDIEVNGSIVDQVVDVTAYQLVGRALDEVITVRVRAVLGSEVSAWSDAVVAEAGPAAPTDLVAALQGGGGANGSAGSGLLSSPGAGSGYQVVNEASHLAGDQAYGPEQWFRVDISWQSFSVSGFSEPWNGLSLTVDPEAGSGVFTAPDVSVPYIPLSQSAPGYPLPGIIGAGSVSFYVRGNDYWKAVVASSAGVAFDIPFSWTSTPV